MRIHLSLLAMALLGSAAVAQSTNQYFYLAGYNTSFTSRGSLGTNAGETLQGFHASHFRGLGEHNGNQPYGTAELTQLRIVTQDQNCATNETWDFVVRKGVTGPNQDVPMGGAAGELGALTNLRLPNSTTNGACAWGITYTLAATARIQLPRQTATNPNVNTFFAIGCRHTASPNWVNDGHSNHTTFAVHASRGFMHTWADTGTGNDPDHAWQFIGTTTIATQPSSNRVWRYQGGTHGVVLALGCGTTSGNTFFKYSPGDYGMGGMFPKPSSSSAPLPFLARIRGGSTYAGAPNVAVLSLIPSWQIPVLVTPFGQSARLYLPNLGATFFVFGGNADGNGQSVITMAPFVPDLKNTTLATLPIQGFINHPTNGFALSNAQAVTPK